MFPSLHVSSSFGSPSNTFLNIEIRPQKYFRYYRVIPAEQYTREWRINILRDNTLNLPQVETTHCSRCNKQLKIKHPFNPDGDEYISCDRFPQRFYHQVIIDEDDYSYYMQRFFCSDECVDTFDQFYLSDKNMIKLEYCKPLVPIIEEDEEDDGRPLLWDGEYYEESDDEDKFEHEMLLNMEREEVQDNRTDVELGWEVATYKKIKSNV